MIWIPPEEKTMGKLVGISFALGIILVIILMFPNITGSIHAADTSNFTDTFINVATGPGISIATVNLTQALYNGDIREVLRINSDNAQDHPSSLSYDPDTGEYVIKSLLANSSRNFTVIYNSSAVGGFLGMHQIFGISPLFIWMIILGVGGLAIWFFFIKGRG
jgi:hypothetical protein